eukprot:6904818-Pyramimonas_sp.AAC.2
MGLRCRISEEIARANPDLIIADDDQLYVPRESQNRACGGQRTPSTEKQYGKVRVRVRANSERVPLIAAPRS